MLITWLQFQVHSALAPWMNRKLDLCCTQVGAIVLLINYCHCFLSIQAVPPLPPLPCPHATPLSDTLNPYQPFLSSQSPSQAHVHRYSLSPILANPYPTQTPLYPHLTPVFYSTLSLSLHVPIQFHPSPTSSFSNLTPSYCPYAVPSLPIPPLSQTSHLKHWILWMENFALCFAKPCSNKHPAWISFWL